MEGCSGGNLDSSPIDGSGGHARWTKNALSDLSKNGLNFPKKLGEKDLVGPIFFFRRRKLNHLNAVDSAASGGRKSKQSGRQKSSNLPPKQAWLLPPKQAWSTVKESSQREMESSQGSMESSLPSLYSTTLVLRPIPDHSVPALSHSAKDVVVDFGNVVPVSLPGAFLPDKLRGKPQ